MQIILGLLGRTFCGSEQDQATFDKWELGVLLSGKGAKSIIANLKKHCDPEYVLIQTVESDSKLSAIDVQQCMAREEVAVFKNSEFVREKDSRVILFELVQFPKEWTRQGLVDEDERLTPCLGRRFFHVDCLNLFQGEISSADVEEMKNIYAKMKDHGQGDKDFWNVFPDSLKFNLNHPKSTA